MDDNDYSFIRVVNSNNPENETNTDCQLLQHLNSIVNSFRINNSMIQYLNCKVGFASQFFLATLVASR